MGKAFIGILLFLLAACAAQPEQMQDLRSDAREYRVVLPYETWGEDWPGFDQLIARLAGVHRVWEVEPGIFAVVHTGDCAQLVRDLKSLAVEQGAHLQSCELAQ